MVQDHRVIDCHVHLNNYHEERLPTEANRQRLIDTMDRNGIDHALVLTSYRVNDARPGVAEVLEHCRDTDRLSVVEGVPLTDPERAPDWEAIEARASEREIVGLKLYPGYEYFYPHDKVCEPLYEIAARHRLPVMVHSGDTYSPKGKLKFSHPFEIDEAAVDHPDVNFVICHMGNPWMRDTAELVYKNENVYTDISGLAVREFSEALERWTHTQVRDFIEFSGEPHDILFGTDWPIVSQASYLKFMAGLDLDPEVREMVMWKNTNELFRLGLTT